MKIKVNLKKLLYGGFTVLAISLSLIFIFKDLLYLFELRSLDIRFHLRDMSNRNPVIHEKIINVNIDDFSRKESGKIVEWPKSYYADLINKLQSYDPGVIPCDILFGHSNDTLGNGQLVQSVSSGNGVVISPYLYTGSENEITAGLYSSFMMDSGLEFMPDFSPEVNVNKNNVLFAPFDQIVYESLAVGFVNIERDPDGVVRRIPVFTNVQGKLALHLFFQSICDYLGYDPSKIEIYEQMIVLKDFPQVSEDGTNNIDLTIPVDENGYLIINYAGKFNLENYPESKSAWDIMQFDGKIDHFSDKIIILSDISAVGKDFTITPLDPIFPKSYLFTNAISSILHQEFITEWTTKKYSIYLTLLISIMFLTGIYFTGKRYALTSLTLIFSHILLCLIAFILWNQIIPLVSGTIILSSLFLFITFYKFVSVEHEKGVLEGSLKSYLSPHLMAKIEENPDLLKLGGERKKISVVFADLANFTTFCDTADPAEVQEVLSLYFAEAADVIFAEGGIIDKYLGDGILAFFENEGDSISSPMKATRASIELQKRADKINSIFESQNRFPFKIRVGISTGYAKVGNIGPPEKIDYTIIGSVVNLAARLQGFGDDGDIVVDEDTQFFLKDEFKIESCGEQSLKGYAKKIPIYKIHYNKTS
jgi:adenylate cyclase